MSQQDTTAKQTIHNNQYQLRYLENSNRPTLHTSSLLKVTLL